MRLLEVCGYFILCKRNGVGIYVKLFQDGILYIFEMFVLKWLIYLLDYYYLQFIMSFFDEERVLVVVLNLLKWEWFLFMNVNFFDVVLVKGIDINVNDCCVGNLVYFII